MSVELQLMIIFIFFFILFSVFFPVMTKMKTVHFPKPTVVALFEMVIIHLHCKIRELCVKRVTDISLHSFAAFG